MVVLSDIVNTFWGVTLNTGKWYTQTVDKSFHISMAAIIPSQDSKHAGPVSVMLKHHGDEFLLCTLMQNKIYQQTLDLNFSEHEEITLYIKGKGCVHLTGYLIPDDDIMDMDEEDDDDELDDVDYIEGDQMDSEASLADNSDSEESSTDDRELVEAGETLDADDDDEDAPRLTFLKDMASDESDLDSDEEPDVDSNDEESDDEASDEESMETASPMASGKRKKNQDSSKKLKKQKQANGHEFILDEAEEDEDQVDDSFEQTPSKKSKNRQKKLKQAQDSAKKQSENKSNSNKNSQSVTKDGGRTPTTKANTKKKKVPTATLR